MDPVTAEYSTSTPTAVPTNLVYPLEADFFGLGDSFAAGIGASCGTITLDDPSNGGCKKCQGAYPYQTRFGADNRGLEDATFKFYACSGAKTDGVINPPGPGKNSQVAQIAALKAEGLTDFSKIGWSTLSLGGNNVGFSRIVLRCLMFNGDDCEEQWTRTAQRIQGSDLQANLTLAMTQILDQMEATNFRLYVTGYAQFFNEDTYLCESKRMLPIDIHNKIPLLTSELRFRANRAVVELNNAINRAINTVNGQRQDNRKATFVDIDPLYEGNRFCEDRSNWKSGAWFFSAFGSDIGTASFDVTPDQAPDLSSHATASVVTIDLTSVNTTTCDDGSDDMGSLYDGFQCELAKYIEDNIHVLKASDLFNRTSEDSDDPTTYNIVPPGGIAGVTVPQLGPFNPWKMFHPKTIGLAATASKVHLFWSVRA
jgi:hypothetical protein